MGYPKEVYVQGNLAPGKPSNRFSQVQMKSTNERANGPIGISAFIQHQFNTGVITIPSGSGEGGIYEGPGSVDVPTVATLNNAMVFSGTTDIADQTVTTTWGTEVLSGIPVDGFGVQVSHDDVPGFFSTAYFGDAVGIGGQKTDFFISASNFPPTAGATLAGYYNDVTGLSNLAIGTRSLTTDDSNTSVGANSVDGTSTITVVGTTTGSGDPTVQLVGNATGTGRPFAYLIAQNDVGATAGVAAMQVIDGNTGDTNIVSLGNTNVAIGNFAGGTYYALPLVRGNNGDILVSDGSGIMTFQSPSTGGTLLEVHDIGFADVNAGAATPSITLTNAGVYPANIKIKEAYLKVITPFASVTRDIDEVLFSANNVAMAQPEKVGEMKNFGTYGIATADFHIRPGEIAYALNLGATADNDTVITFSGGNNPQDYTAGQMKLYVVYETFPTLV